MASKQTTKAVVKPAKKSKPVKKTAPTTIDHRPPIVTIMGHVDHGKTTLLDTIRKSHVTAGEAGGITQHIGAYQIDNEGKKITFIDTPGHAAFAKMRARGAQVTDIVILIVAATEGPKPQTIESINHIRAADVPFIVALNKIDLPDADPITVKSELAKYEVMVEEFGGDIPVVEISAKTGKNIDQLLEMIQLIADLNPPQGTAADELEAIVIESHLDKNRGPVATAIVRQGTLKLGQNIFVDEMSAKARTLHDDKNQSLPSAGPSTPVLITGFKSPPPVGSRIGATPHIQVTVEPKKDLPKLKMVEEEVDIEAMLEGEEPVKRPSIEIILKVDVEGVLEAIKSNLSEEVIIVGAGVGPVTESDVLLASSSGARIFAFNVPVSADVAKIAANESVTIKKYRVIYELLDDVEKSILKLLEPTIDEEELGTAEIIASFDIRNDRIAGCRVKTGVISKIDLLHLKRGDKIIADAKIKSLKQNKQDVDRVKAKDECGIIFSPTHLKYEIGDTISAYRKLSED